MQAGPAVIHAIHSNYKETSCNALNAAYYQAQVTLLPWFHDKNKNKSNIQAYTNDFFKKFNHVFFKHTFIVNIKQCFIMFWY